jgi:hypothetical protein
MSMLRTCFLAIVATSFCWTAVSAQSTPADVVPADASGFVHVPLAAIARTDAMKMYRDLLKDAGEAYAIFERRVVPSITSLDTLTVYFRVTDPNVPPLFVFILTTTKDIEPVAFVKQWLPDSREENAGKGRVYFNEASDIAIRFQGRRTILFGPVASIRSEAAKAFVREGPLAASLKKATGNTLIAAVDPSFVPPMAQAMVPPPFQPLLKTKLAVASLDVTKGNRIDFRLSFPSAAEAQAGEKSLRTAMDMAREKMAGPREQMMMKLRGDGPIPLDKLPEAAAAVFAVGAIDKADKLLASPPLTTKDADIDIALDIPPGLDNVQLTVPVMMALLVPAVQKVREAAARTQKNNNLRQLAIAVHNYHGEKNKLPTGAICDKTGKPLLSWRVAMLPYIEQEELYKKFKLDEPWNSDHNKKLIPLMPKTFASVDDANPKPGHTHFRAFVGGGALFDWNQATTLARVADGTSNTLMIAEATDSVPWSAPQELEYDPKGKLPRLGLPGSNRFSVAFADASIRSIRSSLREATLRALITRAGGEQIDDDLDD